MLYTYATTADDSCCHVPIPTRMFIYLFIYFFPFKVSLLRSLTVYMTMSVTKITYRLF